MRVCVRQTWTHYAALLVTSHLPRGQCLLMSHELPGLELELTRTAVTTDHLSEEAKGGYFCVRPSREERL
ncbi:hypothetical protein NDU88_001050 [Pleurodeles waltl]|uniref:Uncharacterized protein n=1 Tax=Pleurodeles waltl TaxID=8319 RepID=A0AAV7URQ3_PLEWA|nr:hypothetical protein NDU88_001050 [Pleurodeles waltl]